MLSMNSCFGTRQQDKKKKKNEISVEIFGESFFFQIFPLPSHYSIISLLLCFFFISLLLTFPFGSNQLNLDLSLVFHKFFSELFDQRGGCNCIRFVSRWFNGSFLRRIFSSIRFA